MYIIPKHLSAPEKKNGGFKSQLTKNNLFYPFTMPVKQMEMELIRGH